MKGGYALAWRKESTPLAKFGTQLPLDVRAESGLQRWMLLEGIVSCPSMQAGQTGRAGTEERASAWRGRSGNLLGWKAPCWWPGCRAMSMAGSVSAESGRREAHSTHANMTVNMKKPGFQKSQETGASADLSPPDTVWGVFASCRQSHTEWGCLLFVLLGLSHLSAGLRISGSSFDGTSLAYQTIFAHTLA